MGCTYEIYYLLNTAHAFEIRTNKRIGTIWVGISHSQTRPATDKFSHFTLGKKLGKVKKGEKRNPKLDYDVFSFHKMHQVKLLMYHDFQLNRGHGLRVALQKEIQDSE